MRIKSLFPSHLTVPFWLVFSLLAFLLRLPYLSGSFWLDEAAQILESSRSWSQLFELAADFQPPLYHIWLFFFQMAGHSEAWLRLASVLPGILVVGSFTALGERWFSRKAAFWTGLLLSTSSLMVFFSQELRPYMFAAGFVGVAAYAFFSLLFPKSEKVDASTQLIWLWIFTLANAALLLSSYVGLFLLPGWMLVAFLVRRDLFWKILRSEIVSALFFGSWFLGFREQLAAGESLRETLPGWDQVVSLPQAKSIFLTLGKFVVGKLPLDLTLKDSLLVGIPLFGVFAGSAVVAVQKKHKEILAVLLLFGAPLLFTWFFSFFIPVLEPKRILYILPWLFVLVGCVSARWRFSWMLGVVWAGIQVFGMFRYWQDPLLQREPWREMVTAVEHTYQAENTAVVFGFSAPFAPWEWYETESFATFSTGLDPLESDTEAFQSLEGVEQYENVIVLDYLRDLTDPQREIEKVLVQKGFREVAVWDYPTIGFVRLFYRKSLFAFAQTSLEANR